MIGLSGHRSRSSIYFLLVGGAAAVLLGFAVVYVDVGAMGLSRALMLPLGILLFVPFFVALFRKRAVNLLEPIFVVVFGYGLFLFVRPMYILVFNDFEAMNFLGSSKEAVPLAISFSILGLAALYVGYYSFVGPSLARWLPEGRVDASPRRLRNWGSLVLIAGIALYGVFLGGSSGGSLSSTTLSSSAYFYLGIDIAAAGILLLFYWVMSSPRWRRILLFALLAIIFFVAATYLGSRYRVVYLGLALIASYYLLRGKPFSFRSLLISLPPAFIYVAGVGILRGGERTVTLSKLGEFDASAAVRRFFDSSGDLNIFDAYTRIITIFPNSIPFVIPGRTLLYLFVAFIPRSLWPGKPLPTEMVVNLQAIGNIGPVAAGTGYGYSLPGSFYIEGGLVMVLIGMFVFGVFCRTIWSYYQLHGHLLSCAVLAVSLPYMLLLQRGGFTDNDAIWYLTYLVPVVLGFYWATGHRRRKPH